MAEKPKLIIIDDEVEFTKALDQFFSPRGFEVHVALTGTSGLELIEYHRPGVAVVDLKLPGLNGDEVMRRVQQASPETKIIFVTAYNDGGITRQRLLDQGAFAHFDKPLSSLLDLATSINHALGREGTGPPPTSRSS